LKRDWKCTVFLISFLFWMLFPRIVFAPMLDKPIVEEIRTDTVSRGEKRYVECEITAYTEHYASTGKTPSHPAYGITASGEKVRPGIVAADIKVFPMHSILLIDGVGIVEVKDTGGAIRGNRLDIYFESEEDAIKWGRQKRRVYIVRLGE